MFVGHIQILPECERETHFLWMKLHLGPRSVGLSELWGLRPERRACARACAPLLTPECPDPPRLSFRKSSGKEQREWKWAKEYSQRASEERGKERESERRRSWADYSEERAAITEAPISTSFWTCGSRSGQVEVGNIFIDYSSKLWRSTERNRLYHLYQLSKCHLVGGSGLVM